MRWCVARGLLNVAAALLLAAGLPRPAATPPHPAPASAPPPPPHPAHASSSLQPCAGAALCLCRGDHLACSQVPFHRFPETESSVWHVSVSQARLGALGEAALDARRLRTLVLVASRLHHIHHNAFSSMEATLASLDLGYNEFTEVPIEALRDLKVLNWLNLQNNFISEIDPKTDWGSLSDSLSSLSLSNNQLVALAEGALSPLRHLAQLELDGNRVHAVEGGALPAALALLRLSHNLLPRWPCAALRPLTRLRHLHLRNNLLRNSLNHTCHNEHSKLESLDLSYNELDNFFDFDFLSKYQLKQLILDLNDFTTVPSLPFESGRLEKLSLSHNRLSYISDASLHALQRTLERLDLDHNELVSIPSSIRQLTSLRFLSVAYNRLEELLVLPPQLYSLSVGGNFLQRFPTGLQELMPATLGYLDISYNQISSLSYEMFGAWSSALATLNLRGNRIAQLPAAVFPATLPVRELALSFNDLYFVDPNAFANLTELQVLELSSTLFSGDFPLDSALPTITWLTLDNNNIHYISSEDIYNFPLLEYLNLDFNKIIEFPSKVHEANNSCKLKELRLSYNYIRNLKPKFLSKFTELQSVDLSYNRMQNISERCFESLHNLIYLSLSGNMLEFVADKSFHDLPKLEVLELQENYLTEFSTEYFENVSSENTVLAINVSYNRLSSLVGDSTVYISILDLSHNLLNNLPRTFFGSLGSTIRQVILSHNRLKQIDNFNFGILSNLQILYLNNNSISSLKRRAFSELFGLQILDISHNKLSQLSIEQFLNLRQLRHLRLNSNELRSLPRDCFKNTVLEHVDLSDNHLVIFPSSALAHVGFTLRRLDLARNQLEYLDSAMFHSIAFLHELNLAWNSLTVLSDNTFAGLSRLASLDISFNLIKSNFKELFYNLPNLRRLALAGAGLRLVPRLPLVNLTQLDLSSNLISSYREADVRWLNSLRTLDLSLNKITSLQPAMWSTFSKLTYLDLTRNPLVRIGRGSFEGLGQLLQLRLDQLRQLETIEPRAFRALMSLRSLVMEASTGDVTISDIVYAIPGLELLTLHWRASTLDTQLHGLRARKLRMLDIRGVALQRVSTQAFVPLSQQRSLTLRLRGTSVRELPPGVLRPLAGVPHLALDLTDNKLVSFAPATLYPNLTGWNHLATKLLSGGLVVSGNPLRCGCGVSWVGAWLRRWTGEVGGGAAAARAAARGSTCRGGGGGGGGGGGAPQPLLALDSDEAECHASALSSPAPPRVAPSSHLADFLWIVLLYSLS